MALERMRSANRGASHAHLTGHVGSGCAVTANHACTAATTSNLEETLVVTGVCYNITSSLVSVAKSCLRALGHTSPATAPSDQWDPAVVIILLHRGLI